MKWGNGEMGKRRIGETMYRFNNFYMIINRRFAVSPFPPFIFLLALPP